MFDKRKVLTIVIEPKGMFGERMYIHHILTDQLVEQASDEVVRDRLVHRLILNNAMNIVTKLADIKVDVEDWSDIYG